MDAQFLLGAAKAWIYNNYILAYMSWPFLVYDFPQSFADELTPIVNRYLKIWLKVHHPASPEIFYLPETGLKLKHPKTFLKCMQLTKHHLLSTSCDPTIRFIYESNLLKATNSQANRWNPEAALLDITAELTWESKFLPTGNLTSSRESSNFISAPTKTKRKCISQRMKMKEADKMRVRLYGLCKNGNFTTWDNLMSSDITWSDMIHDLSEAVVSFRINGISNSLPSPSNLRVWGVKAEGKCILCNKKNATAAHILSNCFVALTQNRYTWRHDNVLISIHKDLIGMVRKTNGRNATREISSALPKQKFVKQGARKHFCPKVFSSILDAQYASDWQINFDFFGNPTIPGLTNVDTNSRPDIVIFSVATKTLLWFEETVPLERNVVQAALRKQARYASLKSALQLKGWSVHDFTFEIGALGFISKSFNYMLNKLGFSSQQKKFLRKRAAKIALRSSFFIWSNRYNSSWQPPTIVARPSGCKFPPRFNSSWQPPTIVAVHPPPPPSPPPPPVQTSPISKPNLTVTSLADTFKTISSEISLSRNSHAAIKNTLPFTTPAGKSTSTVSADVPLLSTLTKLRRKLEASTPIDVAKWSNFNSWSNEEQKWFQQHIPFYELECHMGMEPLKNSIRDYLDSTYPVPPDRGGSCCSVTSEWVPPPQPVFSPESPPAVRRPATPDFGTPPDFFYEEVLDGFQDDCAEPPWW